MTNLESIIKKLESLNVENIIYNLSNADFNSNDLATVPREDLTLFADVTFQKPETLKSENIAPGVTIMGVVGSYKPTPIQFRVIININEDLDYATHNAFVIYCDDTDNSLRSADIAWPTTEVIGTTSADNIIIHTTDSIYADVNGQHIAIKGVPTSIPLSKDSTNVISLSWNNSAN